MQLKLKPFKKNVLGKELEICHVIDNMMLAYNEKGNVVLLSYYDLQTLKEDYKKKEDNKVNKPKSKKKDNKE